MYSVTSSRPPGSAPAPGRRGPPRRRRRAGDHDVSADATDLDALQRGVAGRHVARDVDVQAAPVPVGLPGAVSGCGRSSSTRGASGRPHRNCSASGSPSWSFRRPMCGCARHRCACTPPSPNGDSCCPTIPSWPATLRTRSPSAPAEAGGSTSRTHEATTTRSSPSAWRWSARSSLQRHRHGLSGGCEGCTIVAACPIRSWLRQSPGAPRSPTLYTTNPRRWSPNPASSADGRLRARAARRTCSGTGRRGRGDMSGPSSSPATVIAAESAADRPRRSTTSCGSSTAGPITRRTCAPSVPRTTRRDTPSTVSRSTTTLGVHQQ